MQYKDYYKILGVPKTADEKAIKAAYRRLARKYHPDVNKGASERFKEINEAHTVLSDPEKRKRYDTLGPDWERYAQAGAGARSPFEGQEVRFEQFGDGGGFSDFFRSIFGDLIGGGARPRRLQGRGVRRPRRPGRRGVECGRLPAREATSRPAIELTLEDAFRRDPQDHLARAGRAVQDVRRRRTRQPPALSAVPRHGLGKGQRHLDVKIPAGVDTGSRIRVAGEGARAARRSGDLYLKVTVKPDPRFERKGDDLYVDLPVHGRGRGARRGGLGPDPQGSGVHEDPARDLERPRVPAPGLRHAASQGWRGGRPDSCACRSRSPRRFQPREKELFEELRTIESGDDEDETRQADRQGARSRSRRPSRSPTRATTRRSSRSTCCWRCSSSRRASWDRCSPSSARGPKRIARQIEAEIGKIPRVQGAGRQYASPRLEGVVNRAWDEAQRLRDEYISTEHLLIAIAQEKAGAAARILAGSGVTAESHLQGAGGGARNPARDGREPRGEVPGAPALLEGPDGPGAQGQARSRDRPRRRDPPRRSRCSPDAPRTTRC